jgi:glyoxylase-like metal-dependent hydrolase (beta-lactamase superfamily II)
MSQDIGDTRTHGTWVRVLFIFEVRDRWLWGGVDGQLATSSEDLDGCRDEEHRRPMAFLLRGPVSRRWLLVQAGRGGVGIAVLGCAACSSDDTRNAGATPGASSGPAESAAPVPSAPLSRATGEELAWSRVDLGFVSAYVLVRGREAAVVDTGIAGSADAIGAVLDSAGPGWAGVRHVVLTHKHGDHAGSIGEVLTNAPSATGYVGADDLAEVETPQPLSALRDGDEVFGLQIVATPGHTPGHLAVFDPDTRVLVAGDALTNPGGLAGPDPQFTEDMAAATQSVRKLARLGPSTILVGHGDPVVDGAAGALQRVASSLT